MDFLVSLDFYKSTSPEVQVFHSFFTQTFDSRELMFYLFMRSLGEKETNTMITRLVTGDIR